MQLETLHILIGGILGITWLAVSLMAVRKPRAVFHWPLGLLLVAIAIPVASPVVAWLLPGLHASFIALGLPVLLMIGPLLWLYVRALTSEVEWHVSRRELLHCLPAIAALGVVVVFQALPLPAREAMVLRGQQPEGVSPALLGILAWLLILLWVPQSGYYLIRSGNQLLRYRSRLPHVFANTEKRDMTWLVLLLTALGAIWLLAIAATLSANVFNYPWVGRGGVTLMAATVVWVLAVWGLSQSPGFEGHYPGQVSVTEPIESVVTPASEKYSRSALDKSQSERIAGKIEDAMVSGKLYLTPDLTLGDLAQAVGVAPAYVSQTLNETLGESFFDYVNKKRIEAAQVLLLETDKTALDIAHDVGFNARSSFYKAFRRLTGVTPGEYRKSRQ